MSVFQKKKSKVFLQKVSWKEKKMGIVLFAKYEINECFSSLDYKSKKKCTDK